MFPLQGIHLLSTTSKIRHFHCCSPHLYLTLRQRLVACARMGRFGKLHKIIRATLHLFWPLDLTKACRTCESFVAMMYAEFWRNRHKINVTKSFHLTISSPLHTVASTLVVMDSAVALYSRKYLTFVRKFWTYCFGYRTRPLRWKWHVILLWHTSRLLKKAFSLRRSLQTIAYVRKTLRIKLTYRCVACDSCFNDRLTLFEPRMVRVLSSPT